MFAWLLAPVTAGADGRPAGSGGLAQIEGAGGGGLTAWALIAGSGTDRELGGDAYYTSILLKDYALQSYGAALGIEDRLEISLARQRFSVDHTSPTVAIRQTIAGAKLRLVGDAVVDQDRWWPQVSAGVLWKHNEDYAAIPRALGAPHASSLEPYLAATKLYLAGPLGRTWLADATLRFSEANQLGLLGFGGERGGRHLLAEGSLVAFVSDSVAAGIEYRQKRGDLAALREDDSYDVVATWLPARHWSVTAAYVQLGSIANRPGQRGGYASVQWVW